MEYSLGEERSYLFAVTTRAVEIFDLPRRGVIEASARELYQLLTDRFAWLGPEWRDHEARYRRSATELASWVLGPVADKLAGRRLLVAAEGTLDDIPFAALPRPEATDDGPWQPMVVAHEIVRLPSASSVALLRRQLAGRPPAPLTLAVLADPVFEARDPRLAGLAARRQAGLAQLRRLRHSRREAEAITALLDPQGRYLATDFEASRATATSPELERYRILHFATHGFLNSRAAELSGLVLSMFDSAGRPVDGFLRLHEIYNLRLSAELVVLSACQTGLGKAIRGEGLIGLVRGFLYAGAGRVIASLWQIDDEATAVMMERLYRGLLRDGLSPPAALRRAQLEMLQGHADPAWRSPYYWAAFVLEGEWRPWE